MSAPGFAVIDVETTGLFPTAHDRIVEIAIVHVNPEGRITGSWQTLVNPERDLGAQHIHGIRAAEILDAPRFAEIADHVQELLHGRVVVAHNARFDIGFVDAEMRRAGRVEPTFTESLCTMLLAREYLPGVGRTLADCCDACGIELAHAHSAGADAYATAELFGVYLDLNDADRWQGLLLSSARAVSSRRPAIPLEAVWRPRATDVDSRAADPDFLARLLDRMPEIAGPEEHQVYLALLDRCLLDRHLSEHEKRQLVRTADELGIGRATAHALHGRYFDDLAGIAWEDGILTSAEIADLAIVASLLSIEPQQVTAALAARPAVPAASAERAAATGPHTLLPGTVLVLTGEMRMPREEWHTVLVSRGHVPKPAVTKAVALVVAADPDSLSGKARKARDYGIPVVGEEWLRAQLGV